MELISKEVVRRIIDSGRTRDQMLEMVESAVTVDSSTDCISREHLIGEIESLKKSPWFREGEKHKEGLMIDVEHLQYIARKEAVEIVMDLCIRKEPVNGGKKEV